MDSVRVTVAPGRSVRIPHPSGLAELGFVHVLGGATMSVSAAEADALYQSGQVLHPVTGQALPGTVLRVSAPSGPPPLIATAGSFQDSAARAELAKASAPVAQPAGPSWFAGGRSTYAPRDPMDGQHYG